MGIAPLGPDEIDQNKPLLEAGDGRPLLPRWLTKLWIGLLVAVTAAGYALLLYVLWSASA